MGDKRVPHTESKEIICYRLTIRNYLIITLWVGYLLTLGGELHGITELGIRVLGLELTVGIHYLLAPGHRAGRHLALVRLLMGLSVAGLTGMFGHLCF
jgi:hypothetical protein